MTGEYWRSITDDEAQSLSLEVLKKAWDKIATEVHHSCGSMENPHFISLRTYREGGWCMKCGSKTKPHPYVGEGK